ncbi:orotate phosphoribosyltransferase [soil metagenome]
MVTNQSVAAEIASRLLQIKAIKLQPQNPFTWSSGWKSPIYCDNRITLADPGTRTYIRENFADLIRERFPEVGLIAGVATAGIAQGVLVADAMQLPYAYVRPEPKSHGTGQQIEGRVEKGQKVVLIEDLISTGGSSLKAAKVLQEAGLEVLGVLAIFDYGFETAVKAFEEAGIPYYTLSNYEHLLPSAIKEGIITKDQLDLLQEWRKAPEVWGK